MGTNNKGSKLKSILLIITSIVLFIYLLIWTFSPQLIHYYLNDFLQSQHQLELSEKSSVRYNPFTSHLSIDELSILENQQVVFNLNSLDLEIRLHQLLTKNLYASEFTLDNLCISIIKKPDAFIIAGFDINKFSNQKPTENNVESGNETSELQLVLPNLIIKDSEIDLNLNDHHHNIQIKHFSIEQSRLSLQEQKISLNLQASINEAPYNFSATTQLNNGLGSIQFETDLDSFLVKHFSQFLPEGISRFEGSVKLEGKGQIDLSADLTKVTMPELSFEITDTQFANNQIEVEHQATNLNLTGIALNLLDYQFTTATINGIEIIGGPLRGISSDFTIGNEQQKINVTDMSLSLDENISIEIETLAFNTDKPVFLNNEFDVGIESIESIIKDIQINTSSEQPLNISFAGEIQLGNLSIYNSARTALYAGIKSIQLSDLFVKKDQIINFQFNELSFLDNEFSNPVDNDKLPTLTSSDAIRIQSFEMLDNQINIGNIILDGSDSHIYFGKNSSIENLVIPDSSGADEAIDDTEKLAPQSTEPTPVSSDEETNQPIIKIDKIAAINTKSIKIEDTNVKPVYKREIIIDELSLEKIDANQPDNESPFIFKGRSGKYTKYDIQGFIKPFTSKTNLSLSGTLTELSLPTLNPYLLQMLGFDVASGDLDIAPSVTITDSIIKGSTTVKIRGLELDTDKKYQSNTLKSETSLPLNTALAMLQDDKGNVELDIPMQGDVDNPDFGLSGFITLITKKAIYSASKSYLIKAFLPYGELLSIAFSAGKYVMKTTFEDLHFEPMQTSISPEQKSYIDQFTALMQSKTEMQVKVCATATLADIPSDKPELKTQEDKIIYLESIANLRMTTFKEHVLSQGINSARILLCSPKADLDKNSKAKISISI